MYILYENFNTTNQTQPRYEAHENFVSDIMAPGCSLVETLAVDERCDFVNNDEFCEPEYGLFNFLNFFYCTLSPTSKYTEIFGVLLLCCILSYQFLLLGFLADKYFCPALTMISKKLHMSEALAGVTLLAFGNGAPDLFTAMSSLDDSTAVGLSYGELIGAASFICSVVAGSIIIVKPFCVYALTCSRDYLFLTFAILYIDTIIYTDHLVSVGESIGVLLIYFIYIIIVCIDQYLLTQSEEEEIKLLSLKGKLPDKSSNNNGRESARLIVTKRTSSIKESTSEKRDIDVFEQFKHSINPIKLDEWKENNFCQRLCTIIQIPFMIFAFLVPVADYDEEFNGWSKLLNCFHLVIFVPAFCYLLVDKVISVVNVVIVIILIGVMLPVAGYIYQKTETNKKPEHHFIFAIMGACLSVGLIAAIADEIICVLMVLGVVLKADLSFLGCTLLAWGNSIGDLVTNITLSKQGYHKMGFAACTGGPLFNILMSCGISFMYKAYNNPGTNSLSSGALSTTNTTFLAIILCFTLLAFVLTDFQARRSLGILLIAIYSLLFAYTMAATLGYIHAYGTDHSQEAGF